MNIDESKITRFEVIDHRKKAKPHGRIFTAWDIKVELAIQDNQRTLKVFINDK